MKAVLSLFIIFLIIITPLTSLPDEGKPGEVKIYTYGVEDVDEVYLIIDDRELDLTSDRIIIPPGFHNFTLNWKQDNENFIKSERLYIPEGKTNVYLPTFIEKRESKAIYALAVACGIGAGFLTVLLSFAIADAGDDD